MKRNNALSIVKDTYKYLNKEEHNKYKSDILKILENLERDDVMDHE